MRQTSAGTALYFIQDHLGTTRAFTDTNGNAASSLSYDSFGNVTSGSASTRYTYTGRESDIGLLYYRTRWYDPQYGRFIREDSVGLTAGLNLYSYVKNNPAGFADPMGETPLAGIAIVGGVIIIEALIHDYLASRAERFYPVEHDPQGHKRHSYVNCMSVRIHAGNPVWPTIISVGREVPPLLRGAVEGSFRSQLCAELCHRNPCN